MPIATINNHSMYYEVLGQGEPVLCMGGWGTFCHDNHGHLARGLTDRYQVILFDYRGIRDSGDDLAVPSTMELHANDAIGLLDHLGLKNVHLMGLVGMGACVCQEIAIRRPDLARSMLNMGAWCEVDDFLRDQLEMFRWIHRDLGFLSFQKAVTLLSFDAEYYNANKERLLGPQGGWKELNGRYAAHSRLIDACVAFDSKDRLHEVRCPSLIIHAGKDVVTAPRNTLPIEQGIPGAKGILWEDVAHVVAGKEQKIRFARHAVRVVANRPDAGTTSRGGSLRSLAPRIGLQRSVPSAVDPVQPRVERWVRLVKLRQARRISAKRGHLLQDRIQRQRVHAGPSQVHLRGFVGPVLGITIERGQHDGGAVLLGVLTRIARGGRLVTDADFAQRRILARPTPVAACGSHCSDRAVRCD